MMISQNLILMQSRTTCIRKVNFRSFDTGLTVNAKEIDVVLSRDSVRESSKHYTFTLYGYFLGQRIAFPVVQNYVMNTWKKFGIQKMMMNAMGFFFFKILNEKSLTDVLEGGPWMVRNNISE